MKYRGRVEIIAKILEAARYGAPKSRLMYGAYLSHAQIMEYLEPLLERKLLTFNSANQRYVLTPRGQEFLDAYDKIDDVLLAFHPTLMEEGMGTTKEEAHVVQQLKRSTVTRPSPLS